jgi:hypothetical protein
LRKIFYFYFFFLKEKSFHAGMVELLKKEIKILEDEIIVLLKDSRRHTRKMVYPEFYKKQQNMLVATTS